MASPGINAKCPCCNTNVISKCGDIKIWHWAHETNNPHCNNKPETAWHIEWKRLFKPEYIEVRIERDNMAKIADVQEKNGLIIEFQNSSISEAEIFSREDFHENIIWIFNCIDPHAEGRLSLNMKQRTFFWYKPWQSIFTCKKQFFLHIDNFDFDLIKIVSFVVGSGFARGDFIEYSTENFLWEFSSLTYSEINISLNK